MRQKSILFLLSLLTCVVSLSAQNYVQTTAYLDSVGSLSVISREYHDGIGRKVSTATNGMGQGGLYTHDLITYDEEGRMAQQWQPAPSASVSFQGLSSMSSASRSFYGDSHAYTLFGYDAMGRETSALPARDDWHKTNKATTKSYLTNTANSVICYQAPVDGTSIVKSGYYEAGALTDIETVDEDGRSVQEYKDAQGRTVLMRRDSSNDTYYIYNAYGELRFVLPPICQEGGSVESDAYEYRYDGQGRMSYKKVPGQEYVTYTYDKCSRVATMQDGLLRSKGLYRFYLYDNLLRVCVQGTCTAFNIGGYSASVTLNTSQAGICDTGYTLVEGSVPANVTLEVVYYYDDYSFLSTTLLKGCPQIGKLSKANPIHAMGQQTGCVSKTTDGSCLYEVSYYNEKGLVTDSRISYPTGNLLTTVTQYTFTGKPKKVTEQLAHGTETLQSVHTYIYNTHNDQVEKVTLTCGGVTRCIGQYAYDDLGRVKSVTRDGEGTTNYTYNVRSWLTGISGKGLTEKLYYASNAATPCYNGNISRLQWQVGVESILRGYDFTYDRQNRLASASYGEGTSLTANKSRYDESVVKYSANGAIMQLSRKGKLDNGSYGIIDNLTYTLDGNRPVKITDSATSLTYDGSFDFKDGANADTEYTYDANGNMTSDLNKGMTVTYDNLNHPNKIIFANNQGICYNYATSGEKLLVTYNTTGNESTTDYIGPYILKEGKLDKYLFDGGYCTLSSATPVFHFYCRDHLGNIRAVQNESGTVEQAIHYYPFGGVYGDVALNPALQPYKYNGKELDRTNGLDWYDYGARMYDAETGYWNSTDPLAEKYYNIRPYAYCLNNPVNAIDTDGQKVIIWYHDKHDDLQYFIFTGIHGKHSQTPPDNSFVKDFLSAYKYLTRNGGGKALLRAVHDANLEIRILDSRPYDDYNTEYLNKGRNDKTIFWESRDGLELENGKRQTPALQLEHEVDHAIDDITNHKRHSDRQQISDSQYKNKEERRVITGNERITAKSLGEGVRYNHLGKVIEVISPISTQKKYEKK